MIEFLPISSITVKEDRQRKEFDLNALQDLKNSIESIGLMHPIIVHRLGNETFLIAGERRLKMITELYELGGVLRFGGEPVKEGAIPCILFSELDRLTTETMEFDENFRRQNLTWQEHALAVKRLESFMIAKAEIATENGTPTPPPTPADIAEELYQRRDGAYQAGVRTELIVARHLDNPLVARAKTAKEAFDILKKQEKAEKHKALAEIVGATYNSDVHSIHQVDCIDWMREYNGALFDVILTDPPYGIDSQNFGDSARLKSDHEYDDSYTSWIGLMTTWAELSNKITKPQAHAYVFCDIDRFHELKRLMEKYGWNVFRTPLISYKQNSGRVPDPTCGPRRQYELVLYAIKGRKPVQAVYPDIIPNTGDNPYSDFHGAGKSTALFTNLLSRSIMPGDRVLDTFAGTFTILRAGHALQCKVTALENNPTYYGLGVRTLEELSGSNKLIGE